MSQENVESLRLFYEAFSRGEVDDALHRVDPEVELYPGILPPDQDTRYLGREGLKEFFRRATEVWESVTAEPLEMIEAPDHRLLVYDRWLFRGREGIKIERELQTVYTFRNDLIVRIDGFTDKAEALEAVGLSE